VILVFCRLSRPIGCYCRYISPGLAARRCLVHMCRTWVLGVVDCSVINRRWPALGPLWRRLQSSDRLRLNGDHSVGGIHPGMKWAFVTGDQVGVGDGVGKADDDNGPAGPKLRIENGCVTMTPHEHADDR